MVRAEPLSIFTLLTCLYIFSVTVVIVVDSLPNPAGLDQATKVQLNTTKTTTVNKTQILRIISIKRHKAGAGTGPDHSNELRGNGQHILVGVPDKSNEYGGRSSGEESSEESDESSEEKSGGESDGSGERVTTRMHKSKLRPESDEPAKGSSEESNESDESDESNEDSSEFEGNPDCLAYDVRQFTSDQQEYVSSLLNGVTYVPMASTNFYNALTIMLKGEAMGVIDIGALCVSRVWNLEKHEVNIFGLQRLAVLRCKTNPSAEKPISCSSSGEPRVSMQLALVKTDGESYALIVGCLSNGDRLWYVVSGKTGLDSTAREDILETIEGHGFQKDTALEASYDECHNLNSDKPIGGGGSSQSQEDIEQDPNSLCFNVPLTDDESSFVDDMKRGTAYLPYASRDYYNAISLLLTGSDFDQNNVDKACMRRTNFARAANSMSLFTLQGYNSKARVECQKVIIDGQREYRCKNKGFHPFKMNASPVYTDMQTFVVYAGCLAGGRHIWFVSSHLDHIDSRAKHAIQKKMVQLGFSSKGVELSYTHCEKNRIQGDSDESGESSSSSSSSESDESSESHESGSTESRMRHNNGGGSSEEDVVRDAPGSCFATSSSLTELDMKFLKTLSLQDAYMPMASPLYYDILSEVLTGVPLEDHDIDQGCVHRKWNDDFTEITIQGFGNKVTLACEVLSSGTTPRYLCKTSGTPSFSMQLIPVFTDHERFLVLVGCRSRAEKFWVVVSNENHIDNYARHAIHMEIASLGFTTEALELNYHHCEKKVGATKDKESSEEKDITNRAHCFSSSSALSSDDLRFVRSNLVTRPIYIPLGNAVYYNAMSLLLTGKSMEENNADKACLGRTWNDDQTQLTIEGFGGKQSTLSCSHDEGRPNMLCHLAGSTGFSAQYIPVFTDNLHFALIVGCLQDGQKFWFVGSTENHVDNFGKHAVHIKLASLGFSSDEVAMSYHHCKGDGDHPEEGKSDGADFEAEGISDSPEQEINDKGACSDLTHANASFTPQEMSFIKGMVNWKGAYMPMGSPDFYGAFAYLLTNKPLEEVNLDKACFSRKVNPRTRIATISGFGGQTQMKCNSVRFGKNHGKHCVSQANPEFEVRVTPVLTDGEKFILAIGCLSDGQKFWAVNSLEDHVDTNAKHSITQQLGNYGFQPKDAIELTYKHCGSTGEVGGSEEDHGVGDDLGSQPIVMAETDDVRLPVPDEGKCIDPEQTVDNSKRDEILQILGQGVYTPMANKQNYYGLASMLRGKTLSGDEELKNICPMSVWTDKSQAIFGFDTSKAASDCDTTNIGTIKCTPNLEKMDNKQIAVYTARYSIVWSDKENILSVNCLSNQKKNWILLSKKSYVSNEVKDFVLKKIVELGFDEDTAQVLPYDECDNAGSSERIGGALKKLKVVEIESPSSSSDDDQTCSAPEDHLDNEKRDYILRMLGEGVYTPMADTDNFNGLSKLLRGQPLAGEEELKDVCVLSVWSDKGTSIFGFGTHKAALDCDTTNIGVINCTPNLAKMDNRSPDVYAATYSAVWSDTECILMVNCLSNGKKTWILLSTQKTVKKETKELVLEKVAKYGFDPSKAFDLSYEDCDN